MDKFTVGLKSENLEMILGQVGSPAVALSELIKNGIDSNAGEIRIDLDEKNNKIIILDNGDGFSKEDIEFLGKIGESNKKVATLKRRNGGYYAGSKGLGILSAFSLSKKLIIITTNNKKTYRVDWARGDGNFTYEEIEFTGKKGTELILSEVDKESFKVLTDETEIGKLKHLSCRDFESCSTDNIEINLYIDGNKKDLNDIGSINDLRDILTTKIDFKFDSSKNILTYSFEKFGFADKIKERLKNHVCIDLNNNDLDLITLLKEYYKITKTVDQKNYNYNYLNSGLDDFHGSLFVASKRPNKECKTFGNGVKVFVNDFAIYNYLENDNDWLGFTQLSQRKKNTNLKSHNVYGFINFNNFNERESSIEISNERADFIQQAGFKKFKEILKEIIVRISFEIDVAYRNNNIDKENYYAEYKEDYKFLFKNNKISIIEKNSENDETNVNEDIAEKIIEEDIAEKIIQEDNISKEDINTKDKKEYENDFKNVTEVEQIVIPPKEVMSNNIRVKSVKKDKKLFLESEVIKKSINLEFPDLINQVKDLDFNKYYLLYALVFRPCIEDIAKRYLNKNNINIDGDLKNNIVNVYKDVEKKMCRKEKGYKPSEEVTIFRNLFGGMNALRNYLNSTINTFTMEKYTDILNSYAHSPRFMEYNQAKFIANNIIIPLIIMEKYVYDGIE